VLNLLVIVLIFVEETHVPCAQHNILLRYSYFEDMSSQTFISNQMFFNDSQCHFLRLLRLLKLTALAFQMHICHTTECLQMSKKRLNWTLKSVKPAH